MKAYDKDSLTKYPLHWCTVSRNTKHSHSHKTEPQEDLSMPFPEFHAVQLISEHLEMANKFSLDRWTIVYILLVTFLLGAREETWSFSRQWLILIIFSTTALWYGDFPSLSQYKIWKSSTEIMVSFNMTLIYTPWWWLSKWINQNQDFIDVSNA